MSTILVKFLLLENQMVWIYLCYFRSCQLLLQCLECPHEKNRGRGCLILYCGPVISSWIHTPQGSLQLIPGMQTGVQKENAGNVFTLIFQNQGSGFATGKKWIDTRVSSESHMSGTSVSYPERENGKFHSFFFHFFFILRHCS